MNFANNSKMNIIFALRGGPLSVSQIIEKVKEEQSAVSHNLRKLAGCKILHVEKSGKERIYSLNKDTVLPMLKLAEKHVKKHCFMKVKK
ncbi:helix-turn-helix transcriptional regulator [Candidatus Woesearchaeota archaeon]|nr:helix-turn-helix transcriptional regulator [Candidatus Woesearchaeota archaeon]